MTREPFGSVTMSALAAGDSHLTGSGADSAAGAASCVVEVSNHCLSTAPGDASTLGQFQRAASAGSLPLQGEAAADAGTGGTPATAAAGLRPPELLPR